MSSAHLLAHCNEALCVAEDAAVSFFAPKTLKKFRVEHFGGALVRGVYVQCSQGKDSRLHIVDAEYTWCVVSLKDLTPVSTTTLRLKTGKQRKVGSNTLLQAHFHEADGRLHCVLMTGSGVYETILQSSGTAAATLIMNLPTPLKGCVMSVSDRTGLVVVGQRGQRWLQYSTMATRDPARVRQQRHTLSVNLCSLACSPVSDAVAVGSDRGELVVYPTISDTHFFADHWHHTALSALCFSVDGQGLYTGARESILLVWSLSSFTHRKIHCRLGPVSCIVPTSSAVGSTLVLACGTSTLATVDLLQMRLSTAVEGIQWSSGERCSGLVVDTWIGQPVVMLTGLPNVLRVCDPLTQQSVYSLHISSQMETIPNPPRHGLTFAAMLLDGRVIVTYESFASTSLPSLLRFWVYDAARKSHVESQTIYKPHNSEVLALQVDKSKNRVFTLSKDTIKCWEEVAEDANDALTIGKRSWRNQSTAPTPTAQVRSMTLSPDGSLCLVGSDCVHLYSVSECRPGEAWEELLTLMQTYGTEPLTDLILFPTHRVVLARDTQRVYAWDLNQPNKAPIVFEAPACATVTALCALTPDTALVACSDRSFTVLHAEAERLCTVACRVEDEATSVVLYMRVLPGQEGRVAVVDEASGFRVLNINVAEQNTSTARLDGTPIQPEAAAAERTLKHFFNDVRPVAAEEDGDRLHEAARTAKANRWLKSVLDDPAYTAPPMTSVLSLYLKQRSGLN